jgi:hypothetical protein
MNIFFKRNNDDIVMFISLNKFTNSTIKNQSVIQCHIKLNGTKVTKMSFLLNNTWWDVVNNCKFPCRLEL